MRDALMSSCGRPQERPQPRSRVREVVGWFVLHTRVPEQSRSAKQRRSTCRAPNLDGSERRAGHNGFGRPLGPAWMRLVPLRHVLESPRRGSGGVAGLLRTEVQLCAYIRGSFRRVLQAPECTVPIWTPVTRSWDRRSRRENSSHYLTLGPQPGGRRNDNLKCPSREGRRR